MSWRKLAGVSLPYEKQMLIRATCALFDEQDEKMKKKILHICDEVGGVHSAALFAVMTSRRSVTAIAMDYYINESYLHQLRRRFFEAWESVQ